MNKLTTSLKTFWNDEEGIETVEILLILSVLIAVAFLFKGRITTWVNGLFDTIEEKLPN